MTDRRQQWEASYRAGQNRLFWPAEEVVRFTAAFVRKRVGLDEFATRKGFEDDIRWLDLGCGIGRHVIFAHQMGFCAHGLDLSCAAVEAARQWAAKEGLDEVETRIRAGDATKLPWPDGFFNVVVGCGTLDSMPFPTARAAVKEVFRVLADGGLFYCDLVSGDDSEHAPEFSFAGEEVVRTEHERDTIQSYFNLAKVEQLLWGGGGFEPLQCKLVRQTDVLAKTFRSRYHLVGSKRP